MSDPARTTLAIVGAGPVGLEAAAAALELGLDVHVFERGEVGAHVAARGHLALFASWRDAVGPASARLLARHGWSAPAPDACPTGAELVRDALAPLAATPELAGRVHVNANVVQVARRARPRQQLEAAAARRERPFRLLVRDAGGRENVLHAYAVIDASGVLGTPNRAGTGGIPARGEIYLAPQLAYQCEDVLGLRRAKHAGRRTLVVGGGASAATTVLALAALAGEAPGTSVAWATRGADAFAGERADDPLPARAALFARARALRAGHDAVAWIGGAEVEEFEFNSATHRYRVRLDVGGAARVEEVDEVIVNTGAGPDEMLARELQLALDPATLAAFARGADPADADALVQPEPDFWILGARAFGRAGGFLPATGWAQVAAVLPRIAAAAR